MHIMKNCKVRALNFFASRFVVSMYICILYKPEILEFAVDVLRKDNGLKNLKNVLAYSRTVQYTYTYTYIVHCTAVSTM
jgi:hypothetical protein